MTKSEAFLFATLKFFNGQFQLMLSKCVPNVILRTALLGNVCIYPYVRSACCSQLRYITEGSILTVCLFSAYECGYAMAMPRSGAALGFHDGGGNTFLKIKLCMCVCLYEDKTDLSLIQRF